MKGTLASLSLILLAAACGKSGSTSDPAPAAGDPGAPIMPAPGMTSPTPSSTVTPNALPPGHPMTEDTTPKEGPRMMPPEAAIRTYLSIFGGLSPIDAQKALVGKDGAALFNSWSDYAGALGLPDYRFDVPRQQQTNALMIATFERIGVALCDRALEHDRTATPRLVFDFDMPATLSKADFASRFDVMHRLFLSYPSAMAPTDRVNRFYQLYTDTVADAQAADAGASRFKANEAGWAAVCYGLVRHPEFHLY